MSDPSDCPQGGSDNTYVDGDQAFCAICGHEWAAVPGENLPGAAPKDANGTTLVAGDSVLVIKDLKVKGSSIPLKQGTLIRNIRLVDGDPEHIEGHSDKIRGLVLKTCFLKKAG